MIHVCTPYDVGRNLGKAYNSVMRTMGENDWAVLTDYDILFLLPDTIKHLHEYPLRYPDAAIFTCFANRSHANSKNQLLGGIVSDNTDILYHIDKAKYQTKFLYEATEIKTHVSGFLMMVSKRTWNEIKFVEDLLCLGVDTHFSKRLIEKGKKMYRCDGIYVWHTYRLMTNVKDKSHLL
jgi:GT2 family glycosyltransferase